MTIDIMEQIDRLEKMTQNLSDEVVLSKPDDKSWSICGIIEHMISVERGVSVLLKNNEGETIDVESYFSEDQIEAVNQNTESRYRAPLPLHPKGRIQNVEKGVGMLRQLRTDLHQAIASNKIQWNLETLAHPFLGPMTKKDWLTFMTSHFDRHLIQIEKTLSTLK